MDKYFGRTPPTLGSIILRQLGFDHLREVAKSEPGAIQKAALLRSLYFSSYFQTPPLSSCPGLPW